MTWAEILDLSAADLNDTAQDKFTDAVLLPYLNMARIELEEIFEQNDIPVTSEVSAILTVPANTTALNYTSTPSLPADLIEIKNLWESRDGQDNFVPLVKKQFLTGYILGNTTYTDLEVWAWNGQEVKLRGASNIIDIKIDYVRSLFASLVTIPTINQQNEVRNTDGFLHYRTAGLASDFIDEDVVRADKLNNNAASSLQRSLGISVKGMQSVVTRRRPFRAAFKRLRAIG